LIEKYYPVGGVRIEDDILITADGNENLTTAPRGEEALRIINDGIGGENGKGNEKSGQKKGWLY
jgi:Xaa-Pro dipeptidase